MLKADMYLDKMNLCRYWPESAGTSCEDFLIRVKAGKARVESNSLLTPRQIQAFKLALDAEQYLSPVLPTTTPQLTEAGLFPINDPGENALVIVSGNSRLTFEVLATIWAQGATPAYLLLVDCLGNTVDMAMVYGTFTPACLQYALLESCLEEKVTHRHMIVPGLTAPLAEDFKKSTGWEIEVGPLCACELPLFLGDRWIYSDSP